MVSRLPSRSQQEAMRLRLACAGHGWTLVRFASQASIAPSTLHRFLAGQPVAFKTASAISATAFRMVNESVELPR